MTALSVTAYGIPVGATFYSPGRLGTPLNITSTGATDYVVYTVPLDVDYVIANVSITNREVNHVYSACVAVSATSSPSDHEFIEWGTFIAPNGTMEITKIILAPGENLIVRFPTEPVPVYVTGQQAYVVPGTYSWTAPVGVTSVSVVAVGGGGSASVYFASGGGGGALAYKNSISVTPGQTYTVVVGSGGTAPTAPYITGGAGGASSFTAGFGTVTAGGGLGGGNQGGINGGLGGAPSGSYNGGGSGGRGGSNQSFATAAYPGGGGGAGGYSGDGGYGGGNLSGTTHYDPIAGQGGGGGGGAGRTVTNANTDLAMGGGGGVGILGEGTSGYAGTSESTTVLGGGGGSGGVNGVTTTSTGTGGNGGSYGGGGGSNGGSSGAPGSGSNGKVGGGAGGAVRIIWPGQLRQFPATRTADE